MKNVVLNKIVKFVFTENQLKSYWEKHDEDLDFSSLSPEQLMKVAVRMMQHSSHSELEHHLLGSGWRTSDEIEGKMIAEDDSDPNFHIEVIDTEQEGAGATLVIDRVLKMKCVDCGFAFYLDNLNVDTSQLKCPSCQSELKPKHNAKAILRKD